MSSYTHVELLMRLEPRGVYDLSAGTNVRGELETLGAALDVQWTQRDALMDELFPTTVGALLGRWERDWGVLRVADKTDAERQAAVLARLRFLPDFRPATIAEIVGQLVGQTVSITEPFGFHCDSDDSTTDEADDQVEGSFLFYVDADEDLLRLGHVSREEIDYYLSLLEPAHTRGVIRCDDFCTDDDWSVCDDDFLGA